MSKLMHLTSSALAQALLLLFSLCAPAQAEGSSSVRLSASPATRALAVSGNQAPTLIVPSVASFDEGSKVDIQVTATDPDPGDVLTLTASALPTWGLKLDASTNGSPISTNLRGSLGFTDAGIYEIIWTVSDGWNPPV